MSPTQGSAFNLSNKEKEKEKKKSAVKHFEASEFTQIIFQILLQIKEF